MGNVGKLAWDSKERGAGANDAELGGLAVSLVWNLNIGKSGGADIVTSFGLFFLKKDSYWYNLFWL
jgi:hypothetical protein